MGIGWGSPQPQHGAQGPGQWVGSTQKLGGGQFAATRGREGTSRCIPVPRPPRPPHCAHRPPSPGPSLQQPSSHRTSWLPPEPRRALLSGQPGQAERGVTSCIHRSGGSGSTLSELFCSEIPAGSCPSAPPTLQGLRRGYGIKSGPHNCLLPTYCVLDSGKTQRRAGKHAVRTRGPSRRRRWPGRSDALQPPHLTGRAGAHGPHSAVASVTARPRG